MKPIYKIFIVIIIIILCTGIFVALLKNKDSKPELETLPTTQATEKIKIVAFGDSLTAGYDLPAKEAYPAQLESKLLEAGFSVQTINSGVSGETSRGNLERAEFIRSQNPDIVLLGIGGNDALRSLPVAETKNNIEKTIQILQKGERPPKVILLQMQSPLNSGFSYKQSFDSIYPSLAKKYDLELVPFITKEIFFNSTNLLPDGIHLNKKGYEEVVKQYIFPAVVKTIKDFD